MGPSTHLLAVVMAMFRTAELLTGAVAKGESEGTSRAHKLFRDAPGGIVPSSAIALRSMPLNGEVVKLSTPKGQAPAIKAVVLNSQLLEAGTRRLSLDMPDGKALTIVRRTDLRNVAAASLASANSGSASTAAPATLWIGEVAGARGGASSAVLVKAENGGVYGHIRYLDPPTNQQRSFMISPMFLNGVDSAAAAGAATNASGVSVATWYPAIETSHHVVVEYTEPDYSALLAKEEKEAHSLKPPSDAKPTTVDTMPRAVVQATGLTNASGHPPAYPLQPPADASTLAAAMAASAGPDAASDSHNDFMAAATAWMQAYPTAAASSGTINDTVAGAVSVTPTGAGMGRKLLQTGNTVQDLLVVYTPAALTKLNGEANMQNRIRLAVAEANKMYSDSRVPITLNLVGMRRIDYRETSDGQTLSDAAGGKISNLHNWRDELCADLVSVWTTNGCGLAYLGPNTALYSVLGDGCFGGFALAHEVGHNQGCSHNVEEGGGAHPYAYGLRRCDLGANNFRTVMSYGCEVVNGLNNVPTINYFSNPAVTWKGYPTGDAQKAHCARTLAETSQQIAAARQQCQGLVDGTIQSGLAATKCVDAPNFNSGTQMTIFDCHGRNNQRWQLLPDGSFRSPGTNKCINVRSAGTSDGTVVQVWDCNSTPAQLWFYDAQRRLHPYNAPDKCLEIPSSNTANGNGLAIRTCTTGTNQAWTSNILPAGNVFNPQNRNIRSALNGMCLDVYAFNYNNQAPIVMWPCNNQNNQRWALDSRGALRSTHNTNKCIDASTPNTGASVYIYDCHTGPNQRWFMDRYGRLRLYQDPSKCLDIQGANTAAGTRVQLWDCVDVPQQKWSVV